MGSHLASAVGAQAAAQQLALLVVRLVPQRSETHSGFSVQAPSGISGMHALALQ